MEVDLFLSRLKEKSIPNLSKLPIDEDLCKRGLQCAFEKVVESGFHHYIRNEQQSKQLEAVANWLVSPEKEMGSAAEWHSWQWKDNNPYGNKKSYQCFGT